MLYLVDATVVAEFLLTGTYPPNAVAFFKRAFDGDRFIVPELCLNECTNVIWKSVRFRGMPLEQANQTLHDLKALPLKRVATKAVLDQALQIGLKHELAVYDSIYIALALKSNLPMVTFDQKQSKAAIAEGVNVTPITDFT